MIDSLFLYAIYIIITGCLYRSDTFTKNLFQYLASLTLKSFSFCWLSFIWNMTHKAPWETTGLWLKSSLHSFKAKPWPLTGSYTNFVTSTFQRAIILLTLLIQILIIFGSQDILLTCCTVLTQNIMTFLNIWLWMR